MNESIESPDIETASTEYAKRFSGEWGKYLLSRQEKLVADCLPKGHEQTLLSVGGGHAQLANLYTRRSFEISVYGSEGASVELLVPYDIQYQSGNILSLPYQNEAFDVVVAIRLLTHLVDWPKMIEEMCRVSKGQIIIEYPSARSLNIISPLLFKLKRKIETDTRTFRLFNESEIRAELARHGYQVEFRRGQFFFPLVVHRVLKSHWLLRGLESLLALVRLSHLFGSPVILSARKKT